jgi:N-carbamoyl-L-amino-acid hydrolase
MKTIISVNGDRLWSRMMDMAQFGALPGGGCNRQALTDEELERIGHLGEIPASVFDVHAALELHIEQGPVLEAESKEIGVVTGVQHMSRHRVVIQGREAHAGPTPMTLRKDPMMALAKFLPQLYALADQ